MVDVPDDFELALRGVSGSGQELLGLWQSSSYSDNSGRITSGQHYKSVLVERWDKLDIMVEQVIYFLCCIIHLPSNFNQCSQFHTVFKPNRFKRKLPPYLELAREMHLNKYKHTWCSDCGKAFEFFEM